jgi:hypothetical protein
VNTRRGVRFVGCGSRAWRYETRSPSGHADRGFVARLAPPESSRRIFMEADVRAVLDLRRALGEGVARDPDGQLADGLTDLDDEVVVAAPGHVVEARRTARSAVRWPGRRRATD